MSKKHYSEQDTENKNSTGLFDSVRMSRKEFLTLSVGAFAVMVSQNRSLQAIGTTVSEKTKTLLFRYNDSRYGNGIY